MQISGDGENWETIYTNPDNTGPTETVETIQLDKSYVTRYVKMNGLARSPHTDGKKYGYCMMEFEVYGDPLEQSNVALHKTAVSSGSELPDRCLADNLTDGNVLFESRWSSEIADKVWVYVDLGEVYAFNKVVWYWQLKAKSYELQISNDGENWETILANPNNTGPTETVETLRLDKTYFARYVKMNGLERSVHTDGNKYGYCMMEFEVYRDLLADDALDAYLVNTSLAGLSVPEQAKESFTVPMAGLNNIPITWESSDSSAISIDENSAATVNRGSEDKP
ncbi:MAG: discoidin domain-containing protein [Oscillospiraceae bacterium]